MPMLISRRRFQVALAGSALAAPPLALADDEFKRDYPEPKFKPSFKKPQLPKLLVQDFVIYAHSELEMVKLLLDKQPALLNATMDWGAGDFETALGGASHMGRRDIAELLIGKGARVDLFAATMLGLLDVVKGLLTAQPALLNAKGPHGIPLLSHARAGGKQAADVLKYLENLKASAGQD
jgi:hypothetical protein